MALRHLAIIMDGNRRWARHNALRTLAGHDEGVQNLKTIAKSVSEHGIDYLTVFAFSCENWTRSQAEISGLMSLMRGFLRNDIHQLVEDDVRLRIMGDRTVFDAEIQKLFAEAEQKTSACTHLTLSVAVNYGGRQDIMNAVQALVHESVAEEQLKPHDFEMKLETRQLPEVDFLIRTGGEKRLSNFLLWELSYAELYFTDVLWPDFTAQDLSAAIADYYGRCRKYGGDSAEDSGEIATALRA